LACLLQGLKHGVVIPPIIDVPRTKPWISSLTAVVTVTDDGGSSGRLRNELRVLPPGDIRNCLVALGTDESLLADLFQYRFPGSGQLKGHSFGNLFLTALTGVTGDFLKALRVCSDVLAIRGKVYPSTLQDVRLKATLNDGSRVRGESTISSSNRPIDRIALTPANCKPVPAVIEAIRNADIITIGPGSLYTSLLPNLLVKGITRAIRTSDAMKLYIGNLMTQPGETTGLCAEDHLESIYKHAGGDLFDGIILNTRPMPRATLARYQERGAEPVLCKHRCLRGMGLEIIEGDFLLRSRKVRHNPDALADAIHSAYRKWKTARNRQHKKRGHTTS
jgi:uncharacterized cofD-like protein